MSEKLSKEEQLKLKIKRQQENRDARKALISGEGESTPETKVKVNDNHNEEETYTIQIDQLVLKMKEPSQTLGYTGTKRTELIGCFFEPEVAEVIKAEQQKMGRGWKSHLVNELVKEYYKSKGKL